MKSKKIQVKVTVFIKQSNYIWTIMFPKKDHGKIHNEFGSADADANWHDWALVDKDYFRVKMKNR